jgi:hypothetical protein
VTARLLGGLLVGLALGTHLVLTRPLRHSAEQARAEQRRLWAERQRVRGELAGLEHRAATWSRFSLAGGGAGALATLRQRLLTSLELPGVSGVRLEVRPGRPPVAATARLSAEGELDAILELLARLARPDTGLGLSRVRIGSGRGAVVLDLEGFAPEGPP